MVKSSIMRRLIYLVVINSILLGAIFIPLKYSIAATATHLFNFNESVIYYSDTNYSNNGESTFETEIINYSWQQTTASVMLNNSFPDYYNTNNSLLNCCANVAGANIIGFYDRFYENLIPDYIPGISRGDNYSYFNMEFNLAKKQDVINELYVRMGTNNPEAGTSQSGYKNGLTSYVNEKDRNITFNTAMADSSLDINKLNQALNNGNPVSLYLSGYNISQINDIGGSVTINKFIYSGNHIMIIYGYKTIEYFDENNNLLNSMTYLYVSTGIIQTGYYILNNNGLINDAETVIIS